MRHFRKRLDVLKKLDVLKQLQRTRNKYKRQYEDDVKELQEEFEMANKEIFRQLQVKASAFEELKAEWKKLKDENKNLKEQLGVK